MCGLLGLGLPVLGACRSTAKGATLLPSDKVLVIGAGAAGMTAAHLLHQQGVDVTVLEASATYGGRMKRTTEFADFPIPTGAEWLHTKKSILDQIVNDPAVAIDIRTQPYDFEVDYALVNGERTSLKEVGFTIDQKFIHATWFDFFEQYVVPGIREKIRFNQIVTEIDYSKEKVAVRTADETYLAEKVIITVPVKLLQQKVIRFTPDLPEDKRDAIQEVTVWGGCKAFIAFSEQFYPTITGSETTATSAGHQLYYDAAYGQQTSENILGLFAVGPAANPYLEREGGEQIGYILAELDELFDGQATKNYVKHIFQDWTNEPYAQGAYVHYFESWKNIRTLGKPIGDQLYFAGDAFTDGREWSSVHAAAKAAKAVVGKILCS